MCIRDSTQLREGDSVAVDGAPLAYQQFVYLMLNKPEGVVSEMCIRDRLPWCAAAKWSKNSFRHA